MIERQRRKSHAIGPILRINQYNGTLSEGVYTGFAAAYGYLYEGPWGTLSGVRTVSDFGDEVLEHMIGEGASLRGVLEAGSAALKELNAKIPKQTEVTEAVGNSPTTPGPSTSG